MIKKIIFYIITMLCILFPINIFDNSMVIQKHILLSKALTMDNEIKNSFKEEINLSSILNQFEFNFKEFQSMEVTVTGYNSVPSQTDSTPNICAWNDKIRPNIVAISRDLEKHGLTRNTKIIINGKVYTVLDKMNKRYKKRIDIYFGGKDTIKEARNFGIKKLKIYWRKRC